MESKVKQIIKKHYDTKIIGIEPLGGGFYGRAFLVNVDKDPFKVVVKIYLYPNIAEKEALQISTLSKYSISEMPDIYFVDISDCNEYDAIGMNFISGINAGNLNNISQSTADQLGDEMVDNLIAFHSVTNITGFGQLDSKCFF